MSRSRLRSDRVSSLSDEMAAVCCEGVCRLVCVLFAFDDVSSSFCRSGSASDRGVRGPAAPYAIGWEWRSHSGSSPRKPVRVIAR